MFKRTPSQLKKIEIGFNYFQFLISKNNNVETNKIIKGILVGFTKKVRKEGVQ